MKNTAQSSTIDISTLKNGLTVILEPMPHYESVSIEIHTPGGLIADKDATIGAALFLSELTERGVADLDSRELSDAFDRLGSRHATSTGSDRFMYRATCLKDVVDPTLRLLAKKILTPTFPAEEIPSIKELLVMDAKSIDDSPSRKTNIALQQRFLPAPYNRQSFVNLETVEAIDRNAIQDLFATWVRPERSIISIAGNFDIAAVKKSITEIFGEWSGAAPQIPAFTGLQPASKTHLQQDAAQVQICLAFPSAKFDDKLYYAAKVANEVLSGGMFGRLFLEVREKRGLCYSVYSRHNGGKHAGSVFAYSGTTPERAKETLTVMLEVFQSLGGTVSPDELSRAKINLKSGLIIGEESVSSRAGSNAGDFWIAGRIRTLDEISNAIESITASDIDAVTKTFPVENYTLVTLGSQDIR